ncbi:MAG: putative AlkP superfamily pyrophosphatase or phosphodiesterase [Planctomycetota bacterium]
MTPALLGPDTPHLTALARRGGQAPLASMLPAVTCSAQATYLTGESPSVHGAVGNGWFFRDEAEVHFWKQSNHLVKAPKLYERARKLLPGFTCAKLFWWWNMGADVDFSITPRPFYLADGRKSLTVYTTPRSLQKELERRHGEFPFFDFWGPKAGLASTRWIADVTLQVLREKKPTLTMAYLPHLDYDLQRYGPDSPRAKQALVDVDLIVGELIAAADAQGAATVVLSEYGIEKVWQPVHLNRHLRRAGLLEVRTGPEGEELDVHASRAFAVADHQVAHIYTKDARARAQVKEVLAGIEGVDRVLDTNGKVAAGLEHDNAGDLVVVARKGAWFTYYYWLDDALAPDFARTVDIHRKPGYDPCELFLDPKIWLPRMRVANRVARKALGFRMLMDVIPLDANLVKGSHGRIPDDPQDGPVFLCSEPLDECGGDPGYESIDPTSVMQRVLDLLEGESN